MDETTSSILCVGYTNWDVVLHTDGIPDPDNSSTIHSDHMSSGGSATNTSLALSSFDNNVSMLGSVGDDQYGTFVGDALEKGGVTTFLPIRETDGTTLVYAVITAGADPRYFAKNESVGDFGLGEVPDDVWEDIDHVHVTSFSQEIGGDVAQQAKSDGKTVSFNPSQGYKRDNFDEIVDAADVIFLNEREANIFRSRHNFGELASQKCIVITQGSAGSAAYTPNGVFHHFGFTVDDIEDTIGAGDAFAAGFINEWLENDDIEEVLAVGNATASQSIQNVGAPDSVDVDAVSSLLENN